MAFDLEDLPRGSALRKRAIAALAAAEQARALPAGSSVQEAPAARRNPPAQPSARRPRYRCSRCGVLSSSWAAADRHSLALRHPRVELVLDTED